MLPNGVVHLLMDHLTKRENVGGILSKHSDGSSENVSGLTHGLVIPKSILVIQPKLVKLVLTSQVVVTLEGTQSLALGNVVGNVGTRAVITLESILGFQHPKMCRTKHPAHRRHSDGSVGGSNTDFLGVHHVVFLFLLFADVVCCWCFEEKDLLVRQDFLETGLNHGRRHSKSLDASDSHSRCTTGEWPSQILKWSHFIHSEVAVVTDHSDLNTANIKSFHSKLLANETMRIRNVRALIHDVYSFFGF